MKRAEIYARREELLRFICKGIPLVNAAEEMTKTIQDDAERKRARDNIIKDWQRRTRWMPQIVRLQDPTLLPEILAGMLEIRKSAWVQYASGDNTSAKVGALKVALQTYKDIVETLQSLGMAERAPIRLDQEVKIPELTDLLKRYDEAVRRTTCRDLPPDGNQQQVDSDHPPPAQT